MNLLAKLKSLLTRHTEMVEHESDTLPDGAPKRKPGQSDEDWTKDLFAFYFRQNMKPVIEEAQALLDDEPPEVAEVLAHQLNKTISAKADRGQQHAIQLVSERRQ